MIRAFKTLAGGKVSLYHGVRQSFAAANTKAKAEHELQNKSYYDILGVSPRASLKEIKVKYLQLAKQYHPDVYKGPDNERFKYIREAFDVLKSPEKRKEYDNKNSYTNTSKPEDFHGQKYQYDRDEKNPFADIKVDDDINFEEEYEKFFGKPIEVNPEGITPQEHGFLEQLNHQERLKYEYVQYKNNEAYYNMMYAHRLNYHDLINENIKMINTQAMETDEVKKYKQVAKDERDSRFFNIVKLLIFMSLIPISYAFYLRRQVYDKLNDEAIEYIRQEQLVEDAELRKRFVF